MPPARDPTVPWCYWVHPTSASGLDAMDRSRRRGRSITRDEIMETFDRLPPEVRQALADADHPWAPTWCVHVRRGHGWTSGQVIERLAKADRERREHQELLLAGLVRAAP